MMALQPHRELHLNRGSIHICSSFSADGRCTDVQCSLLHICRAWLGGNCHKAVCSLPHSLHTPQNLSVLTRIGISDIPSCDDYLRYEVSVILPQLCIHYALGKCIKPNCIKLHMCKRLLLNGRCSLPGCRHSHSFSPRERNILNKRLVHVPPEKSLSATPARTLQTLLADVLCADGQCISECSCFGSLRGTRTEHPSAVISLEASAARALENQPQLFYSSDESASANADNDSQSVYSASSNPSTAQWFTNPRVRSLRPPNPKARATPNPTPSPSFNPYAAALPPGAVHRASASASAPPPLLSAALTPGAVSAASVFGTILCANDVVQYLMRRGGWCPWHEFAAHFQITNRGDYFEMQRWLKSRQQADLSFCSQNIDWIRPVSYKSTGEVVDEVCNCTLVHTRTSNNDFDIKKSDYSVIIQHPLTVPFL